MHGKSLIFPLNKMDKTKWFLFKRKESYWHLKTPCQVFCNPKNISKYYLDMSTRANYQGAFNEKGAFLTEYSNPVCFQEFSIHLSFYALGCICAFEKTKKQEFEKKFLAQAEWLVENLKNRKGFFVWEHDFDLKYYSLEKPWVSALAQGLGISVLLRAHKSTGRKIFLKRAKQALTAFNYPVEKGSFASELNGEIFFEEAPSPGKKPHILNGHISALFGLYDFYLATKDKNALELFEKGVFSLEKNIELFDSGFWSKYDILNDFFPNIASGFYHDLHIEQLKALHSITGKKIFKDYAKKWENYKKSKPNRAIAFGLKAAHKILIY